MPHLVVEASSGVVGDADLLLPQLCDLVSGFETVDPASVKARFYEAASWTTGKGCPNQFLHVEFSLLAGRNTALRSAMADALFAQLQKEFSLSHSSGELVITVEIREMAAESYRK